MNARDLINFWTEITGQRWRLVPSSVIAEANQFCRAGFTAEELEIVVLWTRRQIARGEGGFTASSTSWRVLSANDWQRFQERIEMAREAQKRGWRPRFISAPKTAPEPTTKSASQAAGKVGAFDAQKWAREKAQREAFRRRLMGGGEES